VIVNRQVHVLPTGVRVPGEPVTKHALAGSVESAQPFDVDVHQLARPGTLVSAWRLHRAP
jgi:hypothetical protein